MLGIGQLDGNLRWDTNGRVAQYLWMVAFLVEMSEGCLIWLDGSLLVEDMDGSQ